MMAWAVRTDPAFSLSSASTIHCSLLISTRLACKEETARSIILGTMGKFSWASSSLDAVIQICLSVGMFSRALLRTLRKREVERRGEEEEEGGGRREEEEGGRREEEEGRRGEEEEEGGGRREEEEVRRGEEEEERGGGGEEGERRRGEEEERGGGEGE